MKDFSQNGEQKIILAYFKDKDNGYFLDIGANDGLTLSNTRALMLKGWNGMMVEPSPSVFPLLERNCKGYPVECVNIAIGNHSGKVTLHESDSHLVNGDNNNLSLLSTTDPKEIARWKGTQTFTPVQVDQRTFKDASLHKRGWDFISIDAEGLDVDILKQIDLTDTQMVCIEWNGDHKRKAEITNYCQKYALYLLYQNGENLILTK